MEVRPGLRENVHWRMAVWSLRIGIGGLLVVLAGLVTLATGATPWVLAAGMLIWLPAAVVTAVGFVWSEHELPEPRPGLWEIRLMLLHDTFTMGSKSKAR